MHGLQGSSDTSGVQPSDASDAGSGSRFSRLRTAHKAAQELATFCGVIGVPQAKASLEGVAHTLHCAALDEARCAPGEG